MEGPPPHPSSLLVKVFGNSISFQLCNIWLHLITVGVCIFTLSNKTTTYLPSKEIRVEAITKTTLYGPEHDEDLSIEEVSVCRTWGHPETLCEKDSCIGTQHLHLNSLPAFQRWDSSACHYISLTNYQHSNLYCWHVQPPVRGGGQKKPHLFFLERSTSSTSEDQIQDRL